MQALSDPHTDLKVIYDRNVKVLTDQNYKLADIGVYLKSYIQFRDTLAKCRAKEKPSLPQTSLCLQLSGYGHVLVYMMMEHLKNVQICFFNLMCCLANVLILLFLVVIWFYPIKQQHRTLKHYKA